MQMHGIIVIYNCNIHFFCNSNRGTFSKVIVIDLKVIDMSITFLIHMLLQTYK